MDKVIVTGTQGQVLGFVDRTAAGFFRAYVFVGFGIGPFFTLSAAVQHVWAASNPSDTPVETFSEYWGRVRPEIPSNYKRQTA